MRISSYDGKTIKYDSAGNPTAYGDQKYVWNGKQLVEIDNPDGTKVTFAYDAQGLRTEKRQFKADGKEEYVVYYIWKDGVLTQQYLIYHIKLTVQGVTRYADLPFFVEFLLDENDRSQGCIINGEQAYMFVRNMQGDVIALADEKGNALVEYNYDPWGKITCTYLGEGEGEDQATLQMATAILCPLTYRGYNYDFTTGLYYLQSRYYNPEWGRFLNCDDTSILLATKGETLGANMFAYCNNDPVNNADPKGTLPQSVVRIYSYINFLLNVQWQFTDYVFGQAVGPVSNMRYGFHSMSYNGCEVIAVYNALKFLGKFTHIYNIIHDFELNGYIWADGLFGTYPFVIGEYMKKKGFSVKTFYLTKTMDEYVGYNRCFIVVYAHTHGIHTVMVRGTRDGRIVVYNRYNNSQSVHIVSSISQLVKEDGFKMIVGYWIW